MRHNRANNLDRAARKEARAGNLNLIETTLGKGDRASALRLCRRLFLCAVARCRVLQGRRLLEDEDLCLIVGIDDTIEELGTKILLGVALRLLAVALRVDAVAELRSRLGGSFRGAAFYNLGGAGDGVGQIGRSSCRDEHRSGKGLDRCRQRNRCR